MKKLLISLIITTSFISVDRAQIKEVDFGKYFDSLNAAFILYDNKNESLYQYNIERCNKEFMPASTFKIPNSIIGLETGVIKDADHLWKWDSTKRSIDEWNRDHTLRSAIKYSVVPYYQELARQVGEKQMQHYVDILDYGNKNIGGGIDLFWLSGDLRITPMQQLDFLRKFYDESLPVSKRSIEIVKDILVVDSTDNYIMRAKTGTARLGEDSYVCWYVGYVEKAENLFFFVLNFNADESNVKLKFRRELLNRILTDMNIL